MDASVGLRQFAGNKRILVSLVAILLPLVLGMVMFGGFLLVTGRDPVSTMIAVFAGAFGSAVGILETLTRATPLLLCALAAAIPAKSGMINLGAEGQLFIGAIAATFVALHFSYLPQFLLLPLVFISAFTAGALWAAIPALLKLQYGVYEVLVCLMMNYIGLYLLEFLVHGPLRDTSANGWPYSAPFPESATLPLLFSSNVHAGIIFAILVCILFYFIFRYTVWGYRYKVIELNSKLATYAQLPLVKYIFVAMAIGGGMAAIAGFGEASVIQGRLRTGISAGYGYTGFLISWLAGHRFTTIIPISILVGGLYAGGDAIQLTASLPSSTLDIFMAIFFIAYMVVQYLRRMYVNRPQYNRH